MKKINFIFTKKGSGQSGKMWLRKSCYYGEEGTPEVSESEGVPVHRDPEKEKDDKPRNWKKARKAGFQEAVEQWVLDPTGLSVALGQCARIQGWIFPAILSRQSGQARG